MIEPLEVEVTIDCHFCGVSYRIEHSEPNPIEHCSFCGTLLEVEDDDERGDTATKSIIMDYELWKGGWKEEGFTQT